MSEDGYQYGKMENRFAARKNLKRLLPMAEEAAKTSRSNYKAASAHGEAMMAWVRIENVYGVHIYKTSLDGWIADIELKDAPEGFPNVIGTPVAMPLESRKDCEEYAVANLAIIINNTTDEKPKPIDKNVFILHGLTISLPHDFIATLSRIKKTVMPNLSSEYVESRLKEVTAKHDGEFTEEMFQDMSKKDQDEIMVVCAMALAERIPRWPTNEPAPPKSKRN